MVSDHVEQQLESVIHVELLMAVEERQTVHCRRYIHLNLPEALYKHDIFENAGRGLAVHIRQFKAVPVQVDRMSVISLIVEHQAIALTFLQPMRLCLLIEARAIDRPPVEAPGAAVDFPEDQRNRFVGLWDGAGLAEERVIPRLLLRLHPARRTSAVGVLDDDAHAILAVIVHWRTQNPDAGVLHLNDG